MHKYLIRTLWTVRDKHTNLQELPSPKREFLQKIFRGVPRGDAVSLLNVFWLRTLQYRANVLLWVFDLLNLNLHKEIKTRASETEIGKITLFGYISGGKSASRIFSILAGVFRASGTIDPSLVAHIFHVWHIFRKGLPLLLGQYPTRCLPKGRQRQDSR